MPEKGVMVLDSIAKTERQFCVQICFVIPLNSGLLLKFYKMFVNISKSHRIKIILKSWASFKDQ